MSKVSITSKLINICMSLYSGKFPTTIWPYAYDIKHQSDYIKSYDIWILCLYYNLTIHGYITNCSLATFQLMEDGVHMENMDNVQRSVVEVSKYAVVHVQTRNQPTEVNHVQENQRKQLVATPNSVLVRLLFSQ